MASFRFIIMGNILGRIDPNHVSIYNKILKIRDVGTRVQTLQTVLSGPEYVTTARTAGIYPQLLQYIASATQGRNPGALPYEPQQQQQQRQAVQVPIEQQQLTPYSGSGGQIIGNNQQVRNKLYKARSKEKALNFFQTCLETLGIEESATLSEDLLKKSYKKSSLRTHPDRGGNEEDFKAVTQAYAYLAEVVRRVSGGGRTVDGPMPSMESVHTQRRENAYNHEAPAMSLDPKNLNMGTFNKLFEETRMPEPDEDGYGDWLKDPVDGAVAKKFSGKFNRDVFNKVFEDDAKTNPNSEALMAYREPQEIIPVAGMELGRDRPSDYTAPFNADGMQYTDLKNAYTRENTFSNKVSNVKVTDRTYDRMVTDRKSAPAAYSEAERSLMEQSQRQRDAQENQRRIRAAEEQMQAQRYSEQLKRRLLVNGPAVDGYKSITDR